jgi:hypothetical protein
MECRSELQIFLVGLMKRTISRDATPYTPLKFHDVSEERTSSILKVDDYGKQ